MVIVRLVFLLLLPATAWGSPRPRCLDCHPPHYEREGGCVDCHRGDDRTNRNGLAHRQILPGRVATFRLSGSPFALRGGELVEDLGCRRCHRVGGRGNGLAADLDASSRKPLSRLRDGIDAPSPFMPRFRLAPVDRDAVITFLLSEGVKRSPSGTSSSQIVHFSGRSPGDDPFSIRCGGCHRFLSRSRGALGKGDVAPNLSGIFTPYYPRRHGVPRFTSATVIRWVQNPRAISPRALMPPVPLAPDDRVAVTKLLSE